MKVVVSTNDGNTHEHPAARSYVGPDGELLILESGERNLDKVLAPYFAGEWIEVTTTA